MVDKSALTALLTTVQLHDSVDYAANSWTPFAAARTTAITVANDTNATQTEVDNALNDLQNAIGDLVFIKNLLDKLNDVDGMTPGDWTTSSWDDLQIEVGLATAVAVDPAATQLQVDTALSDLQDAIDALVSI